jgi:GxxExxY protein
MRTIRTDIIHPELSFKINGILFKVRREMGKYKNEKQYCDAIEQEMKCASINYEREKRLDIRNKIDFLVEGEIILEIKAKPVLTKSDYYQVRRYLDIIKKKLGVLVNMRNYPVHPKRILNSTSS